MFFEFLTPSTLKGHNFFNSIPFLTIFSALDAPIGEFKYFLDAKINGFFPLDPAYLEHLNVIVAIQFATNEQLKDLTHMLCFQIPCYKLYEEGLFSYVLTLKYMCHFGMSLKKFNPKAEHKIKKKISWLFFNAFNLVLSYLLTYLNK